MSAAASGSADNARLFLQSLVETGDVKASCRAAGVSRQTVYRWRDSDIEFASSWDDALDPERRQPADESRVTSPADGDEVEVSTGADEPFEDDEPVFDKGPRFPGAKYRLTEVAYLSDMQLHQPDEIIEFDGIPGHHMISVNAAARAAKFHVLGYVEDGELEMTEFVNDAATRRAALQVAIADAQGKLLLSRGSAQFGPEGERPAARLEVAALQKLIIEKDAELALLDPMLEEAETQVSEATAKALALRRTVARERIAPDLEKREAHAMEIFKHALMISDHMKQLRALGEKAWAHVRLNSNENVAASCVPDETALDRAVIGMLLKYGGLTLNLAPSFGYGFESLLGYEGIVTIVENQSNALTSRFE